MDAEVGGPFEGFAPDVGSGAFVLVGEGGFDILLQAGVIRALNRVLLWIQQSTTQRYRHLCQKTVKKIEKLLTRRILRVYRPFRKSCILARTALR